MIGIIKIGSEEVGMTANAASPFLYRNIFHEDFLRETQKKDFDPAIMVKMGFVMAMQNAKPMSEVSKLTESAFYEWLAQFEPLDVMLASSDISNLYMGQTAQTSSPKKEGA